MYAFIGCENSQLAYSCIKFAALCGISGPAAFEPAHFLGSFLCAYKEMNNYFSKLFVKAIT